MYKIFKVTDITTRIGIFIGLCWLYACIHLDRQILGILAQSLKADLALGDQQLGTLTGSAFAIVYAMLGLYFGRAADRLDRLWMVRVGAWVWSLSCIGGAFASGYRVLIASRAGVALGEAIATAAAVSLMAELAGTTHRARAAGVFFACAFLGAGSAALLGGAVLEALRDSGVLPGWRVALALAGVPGILGAVYLSRFRPPHSMQIPIPKWRMLAGMTAVSMAAVLVVAAQMLCPPSLSVPLGVAIATLVALAWIRGLRSGDFPAYAATFGQGAFRWLLAAFAAALLVDYAAGFWLIPYAQRRFGVSTYALGRTLGALMIGGGITGALLGGWIADGRRERWVSGRLLTAALAVLAETLAILWALSQSQYGGFLVAFAAFCLASGGWTGVAAALAFDIVPRAHRGTGTGGYFLVTTVLGPGLGPFLVGLGSDRLGSLRESLAWCCSINVIALLCLLRLRASQSTATVAHSP